MKFGDKYILRNLQNVDVFLCTTPLLESLLINSKWPSFLTNLIVNGLLINSKCTSGLVLHFDKFPTKKLNKNIFGQID